MSENLSFLSGRSGLDTGIFSKIVDAAKESGTPENAELKKIAKDFLSGDAITLGAASFYDFTGEGNRGKKVYVCNGSACLVARTQGDVKKKLLGSFKEEEIGEMCCLGRCHENAAFNYGDQNYSGKDIDSLDEITSKKGSFQDQYQVASNLEEPLLTAEFPGVEKYYEELESLLKKSQQELLNEINASGLRGRGGAGFPMGFKLDACRQAEGDEKYIVCNADEGDPGAYSDRYLLEVQPHSVLFGMMLAAKVVGAGTGVLYIRAEYPESIATIEKAITELQDKKYLGENILGSGFDFRFKIVEAAGAYICGEETALLSSIEGQRPEVRVRPPYPAQEGLFNRPTVVNNVETFSCLHSVFRLGGESFSQIGRGKSTGPKLVSLDSYFNKPGIYEMRMGTPLQEVFEKFGGGFKSPVKAVQVGGPLCGIVPNASFDKITLDFESFAEQGFLLGHAGIVSIPQDYPMVEYLQHLFEFSAHESCGKCFPCRLGSTRGNELLEKAIAGEQKIDPQLFDDLLETLELGSLCALGGLLPLPIKNALEHFSEELKPFFADRKAEAR